MTRNILLVSGEKSGDIHGAELIHSLKKVNPDYRFFAVGGDFMKNAGAEILIDSKEMGVIGLVEIFGKIGFFLNIYRTLLKEINSGKYDAVILIDYPTLNIRLAEKAKKRGLKVFYYISPQLWAWREGRVEKIKRSVDAMFVILPFEEEFYARHGVEAHYIGHPFLETVKTRLTKEEFYAKNNLDPDRKVVCLMPGSRNNEITRLADVILQSAVILKQRHKELQFVLPCAATIDFTKLRETVNRYDTEIRVVREQNYEAMEYSEFLIMSSGSSTLEAGLLGTPMVIIYKLSPFTWFLAKRLVRVAHVGLVNIVLGKRAVPELLQDEANVSRIVAEAERYLTDRDYYESTRTELKRVREILSKSDASGSAAKIIDSRIRSQKSGVRNQERRI